MYRWIDVKKLSSCGKHVYIYVCAYINEYVYLYIYIYICTYGHISIHRYTYICNTLLQHTTATHYCNTLLQHTTATHYCNTLLQHTTATHYCLTSPHTQSMPTRSTSIISITHVIMTHSIGCTITTAHISVVAIRHCR